MPQQFYSHVCRDLLACARAYRLDLNFLALRETQRMLLAFRIDKRAFEWDAHD